MPAVTRPEAKVWRAPSKMSTLDPRPDLGGGVVPPSNQARSETPGQLTHQLSTMSLDPRLVGPAQSASDAQFGSVVAITYRREEQTYTLGTF